jgi:hypothetical protein
VETGDLIRWYEMYADLMIVRDTGLGVILSKYEHTYGEWSSTIYKVYRLTKQDTVNLEESCIEKI